MPSPALPTPFVPSLPLCTTPCHSPHPCPHLSTTHLPSPSLPSSLPPSSLPVSHLLHTPHITSFAAVRSPEVNQPCSYNHVQAQPIGRGFHYWADVQLCRAKRGVKWRVNGRMIKVAVSCGCRRLMPRGPQTVCHRWTCLGAMPSGMPPPPATAGPLGARPRA